MVGEDQGVDRKEQKSSTPSLFFLVYYLLALLVDDSSLTIVSFNIGSNRRRQLESSLFVTQFSLTVQKKR